MPAGGEMDIFNGILQVTELILHLDVGGNGLLERFQQPGEGQPHFGSQEPGVDAGSLGIDRDQLPGFG